MFHTASVLITLTVVLHCHIGNVDILMPDGTNINTCHDWQKHGAPSQYLPLINQNGNNITETY